jgi:prevent-host-death family protein
MRPEPATRRRRRQTLPRGAGARNLTKLVKEGAMGVVNIYEAKTHLSRLVDQAAAGEEIVIAKAGKPMAKLVPLNQARRPIQLGVLEGKYTVPDDFDTMFEEEIRAMFEDGQ